VKPTMKTEFGIKWYLKVIQSQAFYGLWRADEALRDAAYITATLKVPKIWPPKSLKIADSDTPLLFVAPSPRIPHEYQHESYIG